MQAPFRHAGVILDTSVHEVIIVVQSLWQQVGTLGYG